jgi:uncharacterized protein
MSQKNNDLLFLASKYLNNEVASEEEALAGRQRHHGRMDQ